MDKEPKLKLTQVEKKHLRKKRISQRSLWDMSINDIAKALDVPVSRARELVMGDDLELRTLGPISSMLAVQKEMDKIIRPYQSFATTIAMAAKAAEPFKLSGIAKMMTQMNENVAILGTSSKFFQQSILLSETYGKLRLTDWVNKLGMGSFAQHPDLARLAFEIAGSNATTQKMLGSFPWNALGSRLNIGDAVIAASQKQFLSFSAQYASVLKDISRTPPWLESYPVLAKLPAFEYQTHSAALEIISVEGSEPTTDTNLEQETKNGIALYLPQLHTGLPKMWQGAQFALRSDNPDRVRHFNVSVRELFTHILHTLAPDEAIKSWSTNEKDYANGRPTREARFHYICRELRGGTFDKFLVQDIKAMLDLIGLFQKGTHGIDTDFTEPQLRAIELRVESALRFLLEIEFSTNRA